MKVETTSFAGRSATRIAPAAGLALPLATFRAATSHEFRMQLRRRSVWLVVGLLGAYLLALLVQQRLASGSSPAEETASWAWIIQVLMPVPIGVMLADRFVRDGRLRVDEILDATPGGFTARFLGKYAGATAATIVPMLLTYVLGLVYLVACGLDPSTVASTAVAAFLLMNLPGLLFIAAFSVATPMIMPVPVYQFLYVGYWFWGNLVSPQIMPTLSDTWLTPLGWMAGRAWFGIAGGPASATTFDAVMSISLLLFGAAAALLAGILVVQFRGTRA